MTTNNDRTGGNANVEALTTAIRECLSPDAVAMVIAWLRAAEFGNQPSEERALAALREVEWLADTLTEMLGVDEHNRLIEALGL